MNKYIIVNKPDYFEEMKEASIGGFCASLFDDSKIVLRVDDSAPLCFVNYIRYDSEDLRTMRETGQMTDSKLKVSYSTQLEPFSSNELSDGRKLFRRKRGANHGKPIICEAGEVTSIRYVVEFDFCKIDEVEIVNCGFPDTVSFNVLHNEYGLLNEFGKDIFLSDGYYNDSSNYDAELVKDLIIEVLYSNNGTEKKEVGINFVIHEVKAE